jgi:RNA polymerase sigma-70 factor (ECF subfamily)
MTTFFPVQSDTAAVSDLRAWSEEQLLAAAKNAQKAPFGELCGRYVKKLFRVAHRITRNREDAEDAIQDCFLSAFVHLKDFDGRSRFATWLTSIAINAALGKLRRKRRVREVPMDEPNPPSEITGPREIPDRTPDPEEIYLRDEQRRIVNAAVSKLRPCVRKVVELRELRGHSSRKTAQILGISSSAVKTRMFHARATLRRIPALNRIGGSNRAA